MIDALPLLLGPEGYQISRSVRLRSSASAYFNRTPASAGNRKTWTWSGWVKRGGLPTSGYYSLFGADSGAGASFYAAFDNSTQQLEIGQGATVYRKTTQVFRDPSAFYHIVAVLDTTLATAADRWKVYVNGVQVTAFGTTNNPTQNSDLAWNNNVAHTVGADIPNTGARNYFDGYLTEVNFIDGQALTPSSFGETNTVTGVWQPKKYTGTYGTNGFYLNFSDNSAATAAAIGKDYSGNGNNWTPNNISVTSGVTYDSMLDVPTQWADGGNGRGNYAVLNPLDITNTGTRTIQSGNLDINTSTGTGGARSTFQLPTSGKWYFEGQYVSGTWSGNKGFGIGTSTADISGSVIPTGCVTYNVNGNKTSGGAFSAYGASYTTTDVVGIAVDQDAGTVTFYKNNTSQGAITHGLSTSNLFPLFVDPSAVASVQSLNFGQRPFAYTPPSGFKALNTLNLPTPTILKGNQYFNAVLYTGNGTGQTVSGVGFQPDFVWGKSRSQIRNHNLYDAVRGAGNMLLTNGTNAELTGGELSAFTSDGFTLGSNVYQMNPSGDSMVAWNWKEGATQGFDIVTASLSGTSPVTVSHSLGVAPKLIIGKVRDVASTNWYVYSASMAASDYLILNSTAAKATSSNIWDAAPTSTVFTVGNPQNGWAGGNSGSKLYVFYLFAEVAGFSKAFSYTGNGSTDGSFVHLGFRARWLMIKRTDAAGNNWVIIDTARDTYNAGGLYLYPNLSAAEDDYRVSTGPIDVLSNGIKMRSALGNVNASGATYIGFAMAENPFKNSLAR